MHTSSPPACIKGGTPHAPEFRAHVDQQACHQDSGRGVQDYYYYVNSFLWNKLYKSVNILLMKKLLILFLFYKRFLCKGYLKAYVQLKGYCYCVNLEEFAEVYGIFDIILYDGWFKIQ